MSFVPVWWWQWWREEEELVVSLGRAGGGNESSWRQQCMSHNSPHLPLNHLYLRSHLKTHSGEKSHKCNQCDYTSCDASNYRKHLKKHSQTDKDNVTSPSWGLKSRQFKEIYELLNNCILVQNWLSKTYWINHFCFEQMMKKILWSKVPRLIVKQIQW